MNRKIFAAVFSLVLLCSCGNGGTAEVSETETESVTVTSAASETTVTTTAAETASEAVSEETERVTEVSETEKKAPITRDFFNDDVVFEEILLPVKVTSFNADGMENTVELYEYDIAGNKTKYLEHNYYSDYMHDRTYEYDYNPNGTYNSFTSFFDGKTNDIFRFDENGHCIEHTNILSTISSTTGYEYEFDEEGRIIRKSLTGGGFDEYTYDENGRLYEEFGVSVYGYIYYRHEYIGNIENVYCSQDYSEKEKLWKTIEKDENGNKIKETINAEVFDIYDGYEKKGKFFIEYKYDDMNRLIYENHTVSDDYIYDTDDAVNIVYLLTYEYEGDKLKKERRTFSGGGFGDEYFYSDNGSMIIKSYVKDVLKYETEYAMIPKIKTDIEYKYYMDIKP